MKKIKVGVIMGGPSSEHEVSLLTGENIYRNLERKKYQVTELILSKDLRLSSGLSKIEFPQGLLRFDVIFNALHGRFGEDGTLQTVLDILGVPYTGSGSASSWLGMDKLISSAVFKNAGIPVLSSKVIKKASDIQNAAYPFVLKPRRGGSSVGVEIVRSKSEAGKKLAAVLKHDDEALLQKYLKGKEFTCGVLERGGKNKALPVIEIRPKSIYEFFDYEAKYKEGASDEIVPAPIIKSLSKIIQNYALHAHETLGCRGYSRSDFIVQRGVPYILEINTLPGFTANSLVPKAARAAKIPFSKLLDILIEGALREHKQRSKKVR